MTPGVNDRIFCIDLIRGTAVFFLVTVHVIWMYGSKELQFDSIFGSLVHTAGQATAAFLITMGFSFTLTRRQTLLYATLRGLSVFAAGYVLNTLKFIIPISVFGSMPETFINAYGWESPLNSEQLLYLFLTGDILQLAGISFIIAGIVRHYVKNQYALLGVAALSICLYPLLKGYRPGVQGLDYFADLMWGENFNVYFPVLPWISNIFVGMFLGRYYQHQATGESGFLRGATLVGLPTLILGGVLCYANWSYHFNDFFHPGPGGALLALGASLCVFYCYTKLLTKAMQKHKGLRQAITYLSTRVTSVYLIQWTLICWGMGIFGYQTLNLQEVALLIPIFTVLTLIIDYALLRLQQNISALTKKNRTPATTSTL